MVSNQVKCGLGFSPPVHGGHFKAMAPPDRDVVRPNKVPNDRSFELIEASYLRSDDGFPNQSEVCESNGNSEVLDYRAGYG